jgi:hypothetical protein
MLRKELEQMKAQLAGANTWSITGIHKN